MNEPKTTTFKKVPVHRRTKKSAKKLVPKKLIQKIGRHKVTHAVAHSSVIMECLVVIWHEGHFIVETRGILTLGGFGVLAYFLHVLTSRGGFHAEHEG